MSDIKNIVLFFVMLLIFSDLGIYSAEIKDEPKVPYSRQNSVDAQILAYDMLYAQPHNSIDSRLDICSKRILGYIDIAREGIRYVQHHYAKNDRVLGDCSSLYMELMAKESAGLTPLEFILFNMKLALIQEDYPDGYSLELELETKALLTDGRWKTTPFYEFEALTEDDFGWDTKRENQADLISHFISAFRDSTNDFAFKPYVIYTPKGGFKLSRVVNQLLRSDGKHRNLCALPIGRVLVKNSPHGIYNCSPFEFFEHDLIHAQVCWTRLSLPGIQHFLSLLSPFIAEHISDSTIESFVFLLIHEFTYTSYGFTRDFLSIDDSLHTLSDYCLAFERNIEKLKEGNIDPGVERDPFREILYELYKRQYSCSIEYNDEVHAISCHYQGKFKLSRDEKFSRFEYEVRRVRGVLDFDPYHENLEVLQIKNICNSPGG